MTEYIHELPNWPNFSFDEGFIAERLPAVFRKQGRLLVRMNLWALSYSKRPSSTH
ncbi:DUF4172 domain-containing protein [Spongiibacter nanhainus]|uniref:DUF4172 domain-containing protein n=1 Tax=Spongiibacter nanhainus TaxID=2794344 RepID=A0A7T4R1H4_9GAMM|nr:DUF4172 domain-containing protein [Spongiibacter nanhainus]